MKLFDDWYSMRKDGILRIKKDINNRWFQNAFIISMFLNFTIQTFKFWFLLYEK